MSQMKEQDKTPEKLYEVEIDNLPGKEFRMIVKMIQDIRKTMTKIQETFTKDIQELKDKQMNNTLEGINSRITEIEAWVNDLEDRMVEIMAAKQRNEDSLRDPWDNIICTNIYIIGVSDGEEREKGPEKIFKEIIS